MKNTFKQFVLMIICLLLTQFGVVVAQTNNDVSHPMKDELEIMTNAARYMHPSPWPDSAQKHEALKHCAELLRAAIDTNQIRSICSNMTNLPAVIKLENQAKKDAPVTITLVTNEDLVSRFKTFAGEVSSSMNESADLLIADDLNTSIELGYAADTSRSQSTFHWLLWSENGPVRQFDKRTANGNRVIISARFYQNGKLGNCNINLQTKEGIGFNADGTLSYYWRLVNNMEIDLRVGADGNLKVRKL